MKRCQVVVRANGGLSKCPSNFSVYLTGVVVVLNFEREPTTILFAAFGSYGLIIDPHGYLENSSVQGCYGRAKLREEVS
jgi:hypothetical protein